MLSNPKISNIIKKYNQISIGVKASIWFTVCNVIQKGISMLTVPIFTRLMTPEQYGVYSVYQSWYAIISVFATLNLFSGVYNVGLEKFSKDRNEFTLSLQNLCTLLTIILFFIYLIAEKFWNKILGLDSIYIYAMFLELLFVPAFSFWSARERFEYKYKGLIICALILGLGSPLLGILTVISTSYKAEARVFSFVFVQVCVGIVFNIINTKKVKNKILSIKYWRYAFTFNLPLLPHYLSQIILGQSDRVMINYICGAAKAAIYSVAYNISLLMELITNAINSSLIPYTYNSLKRKEYKSLAKTINGVLMFIGGGSIVVSLFGPELIRIFAPQSYYEAIWIIPPVSASVYFIFLYPLFGNIEFYYEEKKYVSIASVGGGILNILLNWIFIPIFGYIAAGYTTLFCYIVYSLAHYFFMNKVLIKNQINDKIYDYKFIFFNSLIVLLAMVCCVILYKYSVIRYILIIGILFLLLINIQKIVVYLGNIISKKQNN